MLSVSPIQPFMVYKRLLRQGIFIRCHAPQLVAFHAVGCHRAAMAGACLACVHHTWVCSVFEDGNVRDEEKRASVSGLELSGTDLQGRTELARAQEGQYC